MIYSLVYRLGYYEAIVPIILIYYKASINNIAFFVNSAWNVIPINKYEFIFHIIFLFLTSN